MQEIIVEKPYAFQPAFKNDLAPWLIQRLKLADYYLKKYQGIESYELRGIEHLKESHRRGAGVLLAPNHCRYADPVLMAWVVRPLGLYINAMASWHLFNEGRLQSLAIRMAGGFSINREGVDRQALDTAISVLVDGRRPLVIFPEGTVFRSNDKLQPLLDGVVFIARSAARRRQKLGKSATVIHPVAIKYLFRGDVIQTITPVVEAMEERFAWSLPQCRSLSMIDRVKLLCEAFVATKELEHMGCVGSGDLASRRQALIEFLIGEVELRYLGKRLSDEKIIPRIKALRLRLVPELLACQNPSLRDPLRCELNRLYVAQQIATYPQDYLDPPVTNTRLLETVEQLEEDLWDRSRIHRPLHAIIEIGAAIEVNADRGEKNVPNRELLELDEQLTVMLTRLAYEADVIASTDSARSGSALGI